jgi:hypothetical protein
MAPSRKRGSISVEIQMDGKIGGSLEPHNNFGHNEVLKHKPSSTWIDFMRNSNQINNLVGKRLVLLLKEVMQSVVNSVLVYPHFEWTDAGKMAEPLLHKLRLVFIYRNGFQVKISHS